MKLTEEQVRAVLDAYMQAAMGTVAREADVQVTVALGSTSEALADLIWDHWMGEPEEPTLETVLAEVERIATA